jgi:tetratricopeptide (TPR) repeat protein
MGNKKRSLVIVTVLAIGISALVWSNWDRIAVLLAPRKTAATSRSEVAIKADDLFWQTFHNGEYEKIQPALEVLTAAYLQTPSDAKTAAHIGWLHLWRMSERARLNSVPATSTDDVVMARKYFAEAVTLDPSDARYLGFLAASILAEGAIHKDEKLTRKGYFMLRDSIQAWPEFNLFTAGYVMSQQPADSPRFREGLDWEWRNLDVCAQERIDRANPDYSKYMSSETKDGQKRACWNSWIAPHNFEGFFLNMGDMLVKAGDWQTAQKIYANAKLSREYGSWKFQAILEERIKKAQSNVAIFNASNETSNPRLMIDSEFSCMGCHQQ